MSQPKYLALYKSGELLSRVRRLEERLKSCDICPRQCGINRLQGEVGFCSSGYLPIVSAVCAHRGEEPALSGSRGSGTIFFGNCNLRCVYCQNYQISQRPEKQRAKEVSFRTLALHMLYLQDELGCHNINLVSPSHFVPQILRALLEAIPMGLKLPLVYNTSAYDSLKTLKELNGIIDIYLPDLRYASNKWAEKYSSAPGYVEHSRRAIKEMHRQVGELVLDTSGLAQRGLIVRHLILPNNLAGSRDCLTWLTKNLSPRVWVSIMSQYSPQNKAKDFPELSRTITRKEYEEVLALLSELGLENGWVQEPGADENYLPDFEREGHPFEASLKASGN